MQYLFHSIDKKTMKSRVKSLTLMCFIVSFLLYINANILTVSIVYGDSMNPSFRDGALLLVDRIHKDASCGDIIIAKTADPDRKYIIKRVIATGGEEVTINYRENTVMVNGVLLLEPYICRKEADPMIGEDNVMLINYNIPDGYYFVMGDNRNHSTDSRSKEFGPIPKEWIIGKVIGITSQ